MYFDATSMTKKKRFITSILGVNIVKLFSQTMQKKNSLIFVPDKYFAVKAMSQSIGRCTLGTGFMFGIEPATHKQPSLFLVPEKNVKLRLWACTIKLFTAVIKIVP